MIYFRPEDGKALGLLWDMDFSFAQPVNYDSPGNGSPNTFRITRLPNLYRRFYSHLLDISTTTVNAAHLRPWAAHYGGLLSQDWSGAVSYLQQRSDYLRRGMPLATPFAITGNSGERSAVATNVVTVSGTAPLTVDALLLNGTRPVITWSRLTNWTVTVPLIAPVNRLVFQGVNHHGDLITNALAAITVTNTAAPSLQAVVINEWMADNAFPDGFSSPADNQFSDWFELYNPNTAAVDLRATF